jgi:hypothetical protein
MIIGDLAMPFWFVPYLLHSYQARFSFRFFAGELWPCCGSLTMIALIPWLAPLVFLGLLVWGLRAVPGHILPQGQLNYLRKFLA